MWKIEISLQLSIQKKRLTFFKIQRSRSRTLVELDIPGILKHFKDYSTHNFSFRRTFVEVKAVYRQFYRQSKKRTLVKICWNGSTLGALKMFIRTSCVALYFRIEFFLCFARMNISMWLQLLNAHTEIHWLGEGGGGRQVKGMVSLFWKMCCVL